MQFLLPPDGDEMAMVDEASDPRGRHDIVAENVAHSSKALLGREHGRRVLVATCHAVNEEHRRPCGDRQVADFVDDQQCRMREHLQARLRRLPLHVR